MTGTLESLVRFPLKGLPGESLVGVELRAGQAFPHDRRFALTTSPAVVDRSEDLTLLGYTQDERLALLRAVLDTNSGVMTIERDGKAVARGKAGDPLGQSLLNQFFAAYLKPTADRPVRGTPRLVALPEGEYFQYTGPYVSLINLASVADLERVARQSVNQRRFRGNLMLQGLAPWAEMQWLGRRVKIGAVELEVFEETVRCAMTTINPETTQRDLNVPRILKQGYGHTTCGVYARVVTGGPIAPGDPVTVL